MIAPCRMIARGSGASFASAKCVAVVVHKIALQLTLRVPLRERFDDLLRRPFGGRMFGDPEVKDLSPLVLDNKKDEQNSQTNRRHGEEINGDDIANVIPEEGLPGLRWWPPDRPQQAG